MSEDPEEDPDNLVLRMGEYPSNSRSLMENPGPNELLPNSKLTRKPINPKRIQKVVKGRVLRKKSKNSIGKSFFGEDSRNVVSYILEDVLIPAAKNTIQDMITSGIEMLLFGETRGRTRHEGRDRKSVVSYGSYFKGRDENPFRDRVRGSARRGKYEFDEIIFESGSEAAEVLNSLEDLLDEYEEVSVADFYELAGAPTDFTSNKWGWKNLSRAKCIRVRNGYIVDLPTPIELDN